MTPIYHKLSTEIIIIIIIKLNDLKSLSRLLSTCRYFYSLVRGSGVSGVSSHTSSHTSSHPTSHPILKEYLSSLFSVNVKKFSGYSLPLWDLLYLHNSLNQNMNDSSIESTAALSDPYFISIAVPNMGLVQDDVGGGVGNVDDVGGGGVGNMGHVNDAGGNVGHVHDVGGNMGHRHDQFVPVRVDSLGRVHIGKKSIAFQHLQQDHDDTLVQKEPNVVAPRIIHASVSATRTRTGTRTETGNRTATGNRNENSEKLLLALWPLHSLQFGYLTAFYQDTVAYIHPSAPKDIQIARYRHNTTNHEDMNPRLVPEKVLRHDVAICLILANGLYVLRQDDAHV